MSQAVAVVTDSTADLPPEKARELGIQVIPLTVEIDGASYEDRTELPPQLFYEKLAQARAIPTTSQPSAGAFKALYQSIDAACILSVHISSKMSGTINSAQAAAVQTPDKRIEVLDSGSVSLSAGYLAVLAAGMAQAGASFDDIRDAARQAASRSGFYAILDTLSYARRSGRIGFAQALMGSVLQVKPIMTIRDGAVQPVDRPRTMNKGLDRLFELAARDAPFAYVGVPHANNEAAARSLAARLQALHDGPIDIVPTGATVSSHCGPGALATCYLRK